MRPINYHGSTGSGSTTLILNLENRKRERAGGVVDTLAELRNRIRIHLRCKIRMLMLQKFHYNFAKKALLDFFLMTKTIKKMFDQFVKLNNYTIIIYIISVKKLVF
jgi:hypothetical protein